MGAYLSEPNLNKISNDNGNDNISYGASSMQGWRVTQEDAHNSIGDFDINSSLFAVYDGHGGVEVATYCSKYFPDLLKSLDEYKNGNIEEALKNAFLKFDQSLTSEEAKKELNFLAGNSETEDKKKKEGEEQVVEEEDEKNEVEKVYDEGKEKEDEEEEEDEEEDSEEEEDGDYDEEEGEDEQEEDDDDEEKGEDEQEKDDDDDDDFEAKETNGEPGFDSGCTAVVALVRDKRLFVANAGDSRCVVCRGGKAIDMSIDHKPEDEDEKKRIEKAGGRVTFDRGDGRVNGGLNLSRALGDHTYKKNKELELESQMISSMPDVKVLDIEETDEFMILACDGIWNSMTSQECVDYVRERMNVYPKLSQIVEELFMHCLAPNQFYGDGTGCDNMTCMIVTFKPFKSNILTTNNSLNSKVLDSIPNNNGSSLNA